MISSNDYKFISNNLGNAQSQGRNILNSIQEMIIHLDTNNLSDSDSAKILLMGVIEDTYQVIVQDHVLINEQMSKMVQNLQKHIEHRYGTVDTFLEASNIRVSEDFAALSEACGYPISVDNVED